MEAHQREYLSAVHKRVRRADTAVISRVMAVQLAWIVALICGAGVTLVQAFGSSTFDWLDAEDVNERTEAELREHDRHVALYSSTLLQNDE
jgi:hypothetical protein